MKGKRFDRFDRFRGSWDMNVSMNFLSISTSSTAGGGDGARSTGPLGRKAAMSHEQEECAFRN